MCHGFDGTCVSVFLAFLCFGLGQCTGFCDAHRYWLDSETLKWVEQENRAPTLRMPRTTSEPPRGGDAEEGWKKVERKKVERKKGKGKSPREKKGGHRSAGGVPTWADIARGGGFRERGCVRGTICRRGTSAGK
jgi:hypothetical protein